MDSLTDNKLEILKVSLTKQSLDNRIYEINHQDADFDDLNFDGDERLIARGRLYLINDIFLFSWINGLSAYVKTNIM